MIVCEDNWDDTDAAIICTLHGSLARGDELSGVIEF